MSLNRCQDYRRLKKLVPEGDLWPTSKVYYLVETVDGRDLGVWYLHNWRDGALMHVNMKVGGKVARDSGRQALWWMFENTDFRKIYAMVQEKAVGLMAAWIGMRFIGEDSGHRCYMVEV